MSRLRRIALTVVVMLAAAVAIAIAWHPGTSEARRDAAKPTYLGDVKPILDGRCAGCHRIGGIAPFSLTSYAGARAHRHEIAYAVAHRIMPPWHAKRGVRQYLNDPSLTDAQIATLVRWVKAGAPRGDRAGARTTLPSVTPKLSRVDLRVQLPEPYTPKGWLPGGDDYHCFAIPWTADATKYVTGFNAIPGVPTEVHHIIAFLAHPNDASTVDAWDAADPGPGYRCYGGASAVGAETLPVRFLSGWAPGLAGGDFPAGTGIDVAPGSRLILQVHYNLRHAHMTGGPKPDRTALEFRLDDRVERLAAFLPVMDVGWMIAPPTFAIPAGARQVTHAWTGDPSFMARFFAPGLDLSKGLTVEGAILHMHTLGRTARLDVLHTDGKREPLLVIPRWDFNWQRAYYLAQPAQLAAGDQLSVRCTHTNTTKRTITWGESSSDEMCIGFVYLAQKP
jgi:mono/diheme cytochrome c family protein